MEGQPLRKDTETDGQIVGRLKGRLKGPQVLMPYQVSFGEIDINCAVSSGQLRAGKEKSGDKCCFSLALDGVGMQAQGAICAS